MSIQSLSPAGRPLGTIRVLHVDDEPEFLDLTATYLESLHEDLEVRKAISGSEGLDSLTTERINCVVSDYHMADMDGMEFLSAVRDQHPNLPFILMTSADQKNLANKAIASGATDFVEKRIGNDQFILLANRIKNAVARYRLEEHTGFESLTHEIRAALVRSRSWRDGATAVCQLLCTSGPFDLAWIGHPDDDGIDILCAASDEAIDCRATTSWRIRGGGPENVIHRAMTRGTVQLARVEVPGTLRQRTVGVVPLLHGEDLVGLLSVSKEDNEITPIETQLLEEIASDLRYPASEERS